MKKKKLKKKNLFIALLIIILVVIIVSGIVFLLTRNDEITGYMNNKKEEEEPPAPIVQIVDVNSKSRPYAVMINNISTARPYHTGLQDAYLVYEIVVEGGITRYMALFKDKTPSVVGSVRSSRHYYLDYVMENDAYYVHWGWSPQAQSDISTYNINNLNGLTEGTPYFFRQSIPISSEHTGYVNLSEMSKLVDKKGYRTETNKDLLLNYSAINIDINNFENKVDALNVDLKYSDGYITNYVYDSTNNVYRQYVNNTEHMDYETKEQYTVKNIITYKVNSNTIAGDEKGRQDLGNIGTGEGYYITEGVAIPITWEKKSREAQTVYRYLDGDEIVVNDGNTWIHIVPNTGSISIS